MTTLVIPDYVCQKCGAGSLLLNDAERRACSRCGAPRRWYRLQYYQVRNNLLRFLRNVMP